MRQQIANVIRKYGEPVQILPRSGPTSICTGSVQRPEVTELVNDMDEDTYTVYVFADDVAQLPAKFDRILFRNRAYTINDVRTETIAGQDLVHMLRVQG